MTVKRAELALGELKALSATIGVMWVGLTGFMPTVITGQAPDLEKLSEIDALTDRYEQARKLYEQGFYLSCLELPTAEDDKG